MCLRFTTFLIQLLCLEILSLDECLEKSSDVINNSVDMGVWAVYMDKTSYDYFKYDDIV